MNEAADQIVCDMSKSDKYLYNRNKTTDFQQ